MKNILYILLVLPMFVMGQTDTENYVKTSTYTQPTATSDPNKAMISVTYSDGLGRPVQQVAHKASPTGNDMVIHMEYDQYNRQTKEYLPYVSGSAAMEFNAAAGINTINFYNNKYSGTINPFGEKGVEASPLGRLFKEGAPGTAWSIQPGSNTDHTIKYDYQTNGKWEVQKFKVVFIDSRKEITDLEFVGYYSPNQLYKNIVKNENWKPSDGKSNTVEEFKDIAGIMVLKRYYAKDVNGNDIPHDTYYVYDDYNNLAYVIPPMATDNIVALTADNGERPGRNYPWTDLALVDQQLAEDYNKELSDYDNSEILNLDLIAEFGGQGGFTISADTQGRVSLALNITATDSLSLRTGIIADISDLGKISNQEVGHLKGSGYDYYFLIVNEKLEVTGGGSIPSPGLNMVFTGGTPLAYVKNYPWTKLCNTDPLVAEDYEDDISSLDNSDILNTYTPNSYGATGGISISIDEEDTVTILLNITTDTPLDLRTGAVFPLEIYRRLANRGLGSISGTYNGLSYNYTLELINNSLHITGSGQFGQLIMSDTRTSDPVFTINTPVRQGLCYIYHYDKRNRLVEKKVPDKDWESIVYDRLDRVVATQDANLRSFATPRWLFTKYDILGRVVMTGYYSNVFDRIGLQDYLDGLVNPVLYLSRVSPGSLSSQGLYINYNNAVLPNFSSVYTVNYYDDYNYDKAGINIPTDNYYGKTLTTSTKGLLTGTKVRILTKNLWITTVNGMDDKARPIWTHSKNGYLNTENIGHMKLDFTGKPEETHAVHKKTGKPDLETTDYFQYDAMQRLIRQSQKINNNTEQLIVYNKYNDIGQLEGKKVGNAYNSSAIDYETTTGLQTVDYTYNIRGWMLGINSITDDLSISNDLFAFGLQYDEGLAPLYNGNIQAAAWKSKTDNKVRGYTYQYDELNRLKKASYNSNYALVQYPGQNENYTEGPIMYDKNGNIKTLERWGLKSNNTVDKIDVLTYSYFDYSNQLRSVNDAADSAGFNNRSTGTNDDYSYDLNGNLKKDLNRPYGTVASHETTYNHLNLPTLVRYATNRHIAYIYDATGAKLEKKVTDGTGNITITHYDGGYVYVGDILQYFPHSEGYVEVAPPAGSTYTDFKYIYQYKDHLGSTRLSYFKNANNQLEVVEESNYYAFGMKHTGYNNLVTSTNPAQKKLYNGKELQDELGLNWYDYQARNYDPILGRWFNIDPLAEKSRRWSPYNYCLNNPVYFIDPDGMEATPGGGGPGGATGNLSSLGADIAGVKTMYFGDLGKAKGKGKIQELKGPGKPFNSMREAAIDFAMQYNGISIINEVELSSAIYQFTSGQNKGKFSYTIPVGHIEFDSSGKRVDTGDFTEETHNVPKGTKLTGHIHTHADDDGGDIMNFSGMGADGNDMYRNRINAKQYGSDYRAYVAVPNGTLWEYQPYKPEIKSLTNPIRTDIPSDVDSKRRNKPYVSPEVTPLVTPIIKSNDSRFNEPSYTKSYLKTAY